VLLVLTSTRVENYSLASALATTSSHALINAIKVKTIWLIPRICLCFCLLCGGSRMGKAINSTLVKTCLSVLFAWILVSIVYYQLLFPASTNHVTMHTGPLSEAKGPGCAWTKLNLKKAVISSSTPPWFALLAEYNVTAVSNRNLYLFPPHWNACAYRLGNRLFNYAATFGISWQNRRIPVWPQCLWTSKHHDIAKFFNLRVPEDRGNVITKVKSILGYSIPCV